MRSSTPSAIGSTWRWSTVMLLRLTLFVAAAVALKRELKGIHAGELLAHLRSYGPRHLALAFTCTAASFLALGGIERLALQYSGAARTVSRRAALLTAFVTHAFSQSIGLALFTGAAVRVRAYARYGVDTTAAARISAFVTMTVALGLLVTGAAALLAISAPLHIGNFSVSARHTGLVLALTVAAYVAWSVFGRHRSFGRGQWRMDRPSPLLASGQLAVSALDWLLTGTVLYALVPASLGVGYAELLRAYLIGQTVGMASHIPGGAGVFEVVVLTLLAAGSAQGHAALVASLVVFRVVYYLIPLIAAALVGLVAELRAGTRPRATWPLPQRYPAPSGRVS